MFRFIVVGLYAISATVSASALQLTSSAFAYNKHIPAQYTCDGKDISPPLRWSHVPAKTQSFVLIMRDPDAPSGVWYHWVLYNIPKSTRQLAAGVYPLPRGTRILKNSWDKRRYQGPCPPDFEHRYFIELYALDSSLTLSRRADMQQLYQSMYRHKLAKAELVGRYVQQWDFH